MPKPTGFHEAFARALEGIAPRAITLDETGSTNDGARALARDGAPHLSVVVANHQTAGRGRLGRTWVSPPGLGLQASWVVRPDLPVDRWTAIPLLVGVAAAEAVRDRTGVAAVLKWPNDLLVGERKLGGILVEAEPPDFLVAGAGINVSHTGFPPDVPDATSVALEGGIRLDRADLLAWLLRRFDEALRAPEESLERYRALCATIGKLVRIERAGAENLEGTALGVDERGALLLPDAVVAAGDVLHLRDG